MSRIARSKSLSDITPIIKAYPPKQPKEAPYRPMHPNLQGAFDASGVKLVEERIPPYKKRFENGDILYVEGHYNNEIGKGPNFNVPSGDPLVTCFYRVSAQSVKILQVYVDYGYVNRDTGKGRAELLTKGRFYIRPVDDEKKAKKINFMGKEVPLTDINTDVMYEEIDGPIEIDESNVIPFGAKYASTLAGRNIYKEYVEQCVSEADQKVNASISFVPTECQIRDLLKQAKEAEKQRAALVEARNSEFEKTGSYKGYNRGMQPLLSKLSFLDVEEGSDKWNEKNAKAEGKYRNPGLCPVSLNPDDTILARLARGDIAAPLRGYVWGSDDTLTVIDDRNMPLGGGSCGPNGILVDCNGKYGKNRINLFYPSDDWPNLLRDYLAFRDYNVAVMFSRYCKKLRDHDGNYKFDLRGVDNDQNKLAVDLRPHYSKACQLLSAVEAEANKGEKTLGELGIGVISFCQTWLRNDTRKGPAKVGNAQFSVMSPHFQTRFYVADGTLLSAALASNGDITLEHLKSYIIISKHFGKKMQKEYGTHNPADVEVGKTGQAFVHLDGLAAAMRLK